MLEVKFQLSQLLTVDEVAEILSLGRSTVYLLTQRGELPCVRIGRSVRIRSEDLRDFIELRVEKPGSLSRLEDTGVFPPGEKHL